MSNPIRQNSNNIYVSGVGVVQGVNIDGFLIAVTQINNQLSPQDPKIINLVVANTTQVIMPFMYNVILYNKLNPSERYVIPFTAQNPISINPGQTHQIILEFPIGKIINNDQWGLLIRNSTKVVNLPLLVNIVG